MRNVFEYLEYSFFTLFSRKFTRITGSTLLVDIISSILTTLILSGSVFYFIEHYIQYGVLDISTTSAEVLGILVGISIIGLFNISWKSIVIPYQSIEGVENVFHFEDDVSLFKKYFLSYFSYITWYSIFLLLWIILSIGGGILLGLFGRYFLIFIFEIVMLIALIMLQVGLSLSWYTMLLEPRSGIEAFRESLALTDGKKWKVFQLIFVFSCILSLGSGLISGLNSLVPMPNMQNELSSIKNETVSGERTSFPIDREKLKEVAPHLKYFLPNIVIFVILFRLESVLSIAMVHIFLMRLTLDIGSLAGKPKR